MAPPPQHHSILRFSLAWANFKVPLTAQIWPPSQGGRGGEWDQPRAFLWRCQSCGWSPTASGKEHLWKTNRTPLLLKQSRISFFEMYAKRLNHVKSSCSQIESVIKLTCICSPPQWPPTEAPSWGHLPAATNRGVCYVINKTCGWRQ